MKELALILLSASLCGCMSDREGKQIVSKMLMLDLSVPSQMYRSEKGRWPKDYSELSAFVKQSAEASAVVQRFGGDLRHYDHVEFTELPDDKLQIYAVGDGCTNRTTMRYGESIQK